MATHYKSKIESLVNEYFFDYDKYGITVHHDGYYGNMHYLICRYGRIISPELTAKECYKTLETIKNMYGIESCKR